jgi:very-short-patch-repair endonuclease
MSGAPATWLQSLQVGVWALGPTARVSHASAAVLYGFDRFVGTPVEFTVDRAHRGRRLPVGMGAYVHTSESDVRSDRRRVHGLPVTAPARTVIDLARSGTATHLLEAAIDSSISLKLTTLDQLARRLGEVKGGGRWRVAQIDALLMTSGGHSVLERRFLQLVRRAGLPSPTPQVVHRREGRHIARVDFLFPDHDVVVEVSGGRGHSSAGDRAKDARRRNELQRMGRTVLEFTFEMVTVDADRVLATLRQALAVS